MFIKKQLNLKDSSRTIKYGPNGDPVFQIYQSEGIPTGIMEFSDVNSDEPILAFKI